MILIHLSYFEFSTTSCFKRYYGHFNNCDIHVRFTNRIGPTTRQIPTTGPIPQMDLKIWRHFTTKPIVLTSCNESSVAQSKWRQMCGPLRCVGLCLLSDPSNSNLIISSGIGSLGLCLVARHQADSYKHRGRAYCSHEETTLLWLRR